MAIRNWLDILIGRKLTASGTPVAERTTLEFGSGFTVTDDPTNDRSVVTSSGGGGGGAGLIVASLAALKALSPGTLADGQSIQIKNDPVPWIWSATTGAGFPSDDETVVRLDATPLPNNGRTYRATSAPVLPTFAAARLAVSGKHKTIHIQARSSIGDGGGGVFDVVPGDTTTADDDGILLVCGTVRIRRRFSGHAHVHWFGMKPDDTAYNNAPPWASASAACAGKFDLQLGLGTYYHWQTALPASLSLQNTTINFLISSATRIHGVGRGRTKLKMLTPMKDTRAVAGDPSVPGDIPMIPHTLTAMLRSHVYASNSFAFVNGHSYYTASGGTTSANPSDAPTGVFLTPHVDGTVSWEFADSPYRGGATIQILNNATDWSIEDLTIDGGVPWVDEQSPPPYRLTGVYHLWASAPANVPLMYAEKSYNQVTYAFGWDVLHKGLALGELANAPHGLRRGQLRRVEITGFAGEAVYGDGADITDPNDTLEFINCEISEAPAGYSSMCGAKFTRSRFRHLDQALDFTRIPGSVLELDRCFFDDCRTAVSHEGGLLDQTIPGLTHIHDCHFHNVYYACLSWINSFSANLSFAGQRGLLWENNTISDCAWGTAGGVVYFVAGPSTSFPTNPVKVRCADVTIRGDRIHCGPLVAPVRSGSGTGTQVQSIFNIGGWVTDFQMENIECILDQAAIDAGHHFFLAGYWQVQSNGDNCRVHRCLFRGSTAGGGQGIFLIDTTSDQYIGEWKDVRLIVDGTTEEWPICLGGYNAYANGGHIFPKLPIWYARGAGGSVLTTVADITHPERWAYGQIVELREDDEGSPLLIPKSSATHDLESPRLLTPRTRLRLRRGSTSLSSDVPHWYEHEYFSSGELTADFIGPLAPPNPAIESYAPAIECWGVHIVHLAPSVLKSFGYLNHAPDEDGKRVQVYCNTNTRLLHNSGTAPAGTADHPKLLLIGGVDYTFTAGGESHFVVDNDSGLAVEVLRIDGSTVITAQGVSAGDATIAVTGGGAITATGNFTGIGVTVDQLTGSGTHGAFSLTGGAGAFVPKLVWFAAPSGNGQESWFQAQGGAIGGNNDGGAATILGGLAQGTGNKGGVRLKLATGAIVGQTGVELVAFGSRRIVAFNQFADLTTTQMPANTGDGVIYIANASTVPTASAVGGGIMYVEAGALKFRGSGGTITTLGPA